MSAAIYFWKCLILTASLAVLVPQLIEHPPFTKTFFFVPVVSFNFFVFISFFSFNVFSACWKFLFRVNQLICVIWESTGVIRDSCFSRVNPVIFVVWRLILVGNRSESWSYEKSIFLWMKHDKVFSSFNFWNTHFT